MNAPTGNMIARMAASGHSLPVMVAKAAEALAAAKSSAEILDTMGMASVVYDAAKKAARMHQAKGAHDTLIAAAHRAQADALLIESEAKRRLADEYDAAQERGEVATKADQNLLPEKKKVSASDLGMTHKQVHEARQVRDAEVAQPGIVKETVERALSEGREPIRAEVQRSVMAAVRLAQRSPKADRRNPHYEADPFHDKVVRFSSLCEQIANSEDDVVRIAGYNTLASTRARLLRNAEMALAVLRKFSEARHHA